MGGGGAMEELIRAVAELKTSLEETRNVDAAMATTLSKLEKTDANIFNTLSKYTLMTSFVIGLMLVHITFFGVWSVYVITQNNDTMHVVMENRAIADNRQTKTDADLAKIVLEQKALVDSTAENNYLLHGQLDVLPRIQQEILNKLNKLNKLGKKPE
jgi:hypothetical protein